MGVSTQYLNLIDSTSALSDLLSTSKQGFKGSRSVTVFDGDEGDQTLNTLQRLETIIAKSEIKVTEDPSEKGSPKKEIPIANFVEKLHMNITQKALTIVIQWLDFLIEASKDPSIILNRKDNGFDDTDLMTNIKNKLGSFIRTLAGSSNLDAICQKAVNKTAAELLANL